MEPTQISEGAKRILSISFVLILMSAFVIIFVGNSIRSMNNDIRTIDYFLTNAENLQANFEQSLVVYTERTQKITDYLLSLRPENQQQYIKFIDDIEGLGQEMSLQLNLQSIRDQSPIEDIRTLNYEIAFNATFDQMNEFLMRLGSLPYLIKVSDVEFVDPILYTTRTNIGSGNVKLKIKLYTK